MAEPDRAELPSDPSRQLELIRALLDHAAESFFVLEADTGHVVYASLQAAASLGCEPEDMAAMAVTDFVVEVPDHATWRSLVEWLGHERAITSLGHHRRLDGSVFPVEMTVTRTAFGDDTYLVFVARDISERRRREQESAQREGMLSTILATMGGGLLVIDTSATITLANPRMGDLAGLPHEQLLGMKAWDILKERIKPDGTRFEPNEGPMGRAIQNGERVDGEIHGLPRPDGTVQWLLINSAPIRNVATGDIEGAVATTTDITDLTDSQRRLEHLATHDALTDLPNRSWFLAEVASSIERARHDREGMAVLFLDLDGFKTVNDSLGHRQGDLLLRAVAGRLRRHVRPNDRVARLGGDEFVVLVDPLPKGHAAYDATRGVAERVAEALSRPFSVDGRMLQVSASVGIALYDGDEGGDAEDLLRQADLAMYAAKDAGRGTFRFFEPDMDAQAKRAFQMDAEVRAALENGQLTLALQPQFRLSDGAMLGAECLLRWRHPERGYVDPNELVQAAERNGLIVPLGAWVLGEACRVARVLRDSGAFGPESIVSVNVSGIQFQQPDLVDTVAAALAAASVPPDCLNVELTESTLVGDLDEVRGRLQALTDLGVRVAIDDFGTGYSSLAYLRRLPIQSVKIDRSFVHDLDHDANARTIVEAVIVMARTLGLVTVAEGVERPTQLEFLRSLGCDAYQGWLTSPALPLDEFLDRYRAATVEP